MGLQAPRPCWRITLAQPCSRRFYLARAPFLPERCWRLLANAQPVGLSSAAKAEVSIAIPAHAPPGEATVLESTGGARVLDSEHDARVGAAWPKAALGKPGGLARKSYSRSYCALINGSRACLKGSGIRPYLERLLNEYIAKRVYCGVRMQFLMAFAILRIIPKRRGSAPSSPYRTNVIWPGDGRFWRIGSESLRGERRKNSARGLRWEIVGREKVRQKILSGTRTAGSDPSGGFCQVHPVGKPSDGPLPASGPSPLG